MWARMWDTEHMAIQAMATAHNMMGITAMVPAHGGAMRHAG
ncbi:hypothetical protein ATPR_3219 [Acetobacter tropicalis NBRC 101654]|uniref:Uncharacterized protein n=1 Tax=Acetobacter tropicalis NBRC 101654 TaxID=749388 RepID=F7VIM0_9PROT|nr:hypothetical protein ATPR_3219 [Acetobacter tropicalis NBRC 101654]